MGASANSRRTLTPAVIRWWQAWRRRSRGDRPREDDSGRRLADAALARADVISARDQVHRDMLRMMWYFGVDPGQVPPRFREPLRDAERICARCPTVGRCQHWFHGPLGDDAPRSFCPSAELYEEIARAQGRTPDANEPPASR
jgi:hypothetical protein